MDILVLTCFTRSPWRVLKKHTTEETVSFIPGYLNFFTILASKILQNPSYDRIKRVVETLWFYTCISNDDNYSRSSYSGLSTRVVLSPFPLRSDCSLTKKKTVINDQLMINDINLGIYLNLCYKIVYLPFQKRFSENGIDPETITHNLFTGTYKMEVTLK